MEVRVMKIIKATFRIIRGVYNILGVYLFLSMLPLLFASLVFFALTFALANAFDFESTVQMWSALGDDLPFNIVYLRLFLFLPLHFIFYRMIRGPRYRVHVFLEKNATKGMDLFSKLTSHFPWAKFASEALLTIVITGFLIPTLIQPTLVRGFFSFRPWVERAANLSDGTAIVSSVDSVVGLYRKFYAEPVVTEGLSKEELQKIFKNETRDVVLPPSAVGKYPMMDRWDSIIKKAAGGDAKIFAYIKAFMWVESGGRQYAVSRTGCSGLMQFCSGTARAEPFRSVFGRGTIYRCQCPGGSCNISKSIQMDMETGDREILRRHQRDFPCEMTDTRFDPDRAIHAGALYIRRLSKSVGGNIYLMYIGYNSGPKIAKRVYERGGRNPEMSLREIERHLSEVLRGTYGSHAPGRARSLVRTHLPKIKGAFDRYYKK